MKSALEVTGFQADNAFGSSSTSLYTAREDSPAPNTVPGISEAQGIAAKGVFLTDYRNSKSGEVVRLGVGHRLNGNKVIYVHSQEENTGQPVIDSSG